VTVQGRNLLLAGRAGGQRFGFESSRVVEASCPEDANEVAMQQAWDDPALRAAIVNHDDDPPLLFVADGHELAGEGPDAREPSVSYSFFEEQDLDLSALLAGGEGDESEEDAEPR
jgi:hypothetical protein